MKHHIRSCVRALALAGVILCPAPRAAAAEPVKGRVLVLDNERTLTGDIERLDDQYRIKRLVGETWVPVGKALRLCATMEEAYEYLRARANLRDPDERLRLADWCRQHGLKDQALAEVEEAAELKPGDAQITRTLAHLRGLKARAPPPPVVAAEAPALPRVEVTAETVGQFASKVQPILMNACVSCHCAGRGGSFQLTRTTGPGLSNRAAVENNLAMVLAQVNPRDVRTSKFLVKAVSIHGPGMTQAPLKGRQAAAFKHLEAWVARALESNPHLAEGPAPAEPARPAADVVRGGIGWGEDRAARAAVPGPVAATPPQPPPGGPAGKEAPKKPSDPLDPDAFNKEFHPERKGPPGEKK